MLTEPDAMQFVGGVTPTVPQDLTALVAPAHTALVLQEVQNGVVGEPSVLPELAAAAARVGSDPALRRARGAAPRARASPCSTARPRPATTSRARTGTRALFAGVRKSPVQLSPGIGRGAGARRRSASTRATSCCRATTVSAR